MERRPKSSMLVRIRLNNRQYLWITTGKISHRMRKHALFYQFGRRGSETLKFEFKFLSQNSNKLVPRN